MPVHHPLRSAACAALALLLPLSACASPGPGTSWSFSGFGTAGYVHTSEREADFTSSVLKARGAGASAAWSADVDSRLGGQLDVASGRWSAVLQVVAEQRLDGSYQPQVEWANVKYQATPELALRLGRIALPMFIAADYRKVGYAYPWVRPPVEVYGSLPVSSSDGLDLSWRWGTGALRQSTQLFYGHARMKLAGYGNLHARRITGFSHTTEHGDFTARVSVLSADLTLDLARGLFTGLNQFGPPGLALAEEYDVDNKRSTMGSVGLSYDPGSWFATAEWGRTHANSYLGKTTHLYASTGIRLGAFTPWIGHARVRSLGDTHEAGLPLAGLEPGKALDGERLNAGLNALLKTIPVQSSASAGVRWDLAGNVALKLQCDRVRPREGSRGMLINTRPGFRSDRAITVASVAADFVF